MCGTDETDYATFALEHVINHFVDDGDHIVCIRVIDPKDLVHYGPYMRYSTYSAQAEVAQQQVQASLDKANGPAVKVVIQFAVGDLGNTLDQMVRRHSHQFIQIGTNSLAFQVDDYNPTSVVVGTRGNSLLSSTFGRFSVSQYLIEHSPVAVTLVK